MGGISNMDRCHRFVDEFNADFVKKFGLPASMVSREGDDPGQGLGTDETYWVVRFYATLWVDAAPQTRTVEVAVVEAGAWDPELSGDDLVEQLKEVLGLPKREARARLRKAGLL